MPRFALFIAMLIVIALPAFVHAQPFDMLDIWIDSDFDGLPANAPKAVAVGDIDSVALYMDTTDFPSNWTNFLYFFSIGPSGPDSSMNFFAYDTTFAARYIVTGGSLFPVDVASNKTAIGLGGSGFNMAPGLVHVANVTLRAIRPMPSGTGCVVPIVDIYNPYFTFTQVGAGASYATFNNGTATSGCFTIDPINTAETTSWGRLKGLYR